jgi:hypothetical protein
MILSSFLLLILRAMFVTANEQKVAQRIPRELSTGILFSLEVDGV